VQQREWRRLAQRGFGVDLRYPAVTPQGHDVERSEERANDHRGDLERVHLRSPASGEVYVEVVRFRGLTPEQEYSRHRPSLERRSGAGSVTALSETTVQGRPARAYAFRWDDGERAVLLVQVGDDTYRVIHDPRSPLNAEILATFALDPLESG
jgi:hypothetical protein